ncbi:MAG TPA: ABC transporter ATP-binding protein [Spirochaetota bacterium]|nr:ABC transporter ATP-binding protein [Spirochaetota bacterium]HPL17215.1 ABC transporter ATP-binding protein [Spirochaetota bacterium]HQJ69863.1 ABC transporter ATP-binding protein [Spirochaetota bacterium]HRS76321.1 ABC transporter ATP-binding protein [Spirochaetota bacterium]HRT73956.1 ABC transporter ATP-binding protein [Spirochaetota bacterium]
MEIIEVRDVIKNYENNGLTVAAVQGVTMRIRQGEFSAIAGPSGSGKTTLLNLIGGLDRPSSGSITVGGSELSGMTPKELADLRLRRIGFVFQAYNLIPVLTARENVEYILLLQGVEREERERRSAAILNEVGLGNEIDRLPKEMSGGQQQRVAVARAIVSEPSIVLADEPTANLDQKTGEALIDLMHRLNREKKITFLFSTHDKMVMERAERLVRLTDGKISQDRAEKPKGGTKSKSASVRVGFKPHPNRSRN